MNLRRAPYGTWDSPISAASISQGANTISDLLVDPVTSEIYHLEDRASENGRGVLVHTKSGRDIVGPKWDVRTQVHEYGGAPTVVYGDTAYFSNFSDARVYKVSVHGGEPEAITPEGQPYRYANFAVCPAQPHLIVSILEDHTQDSPSKVLNSLCIINASTRTLFPLAAGADFYAMPAWAPDSRHLAWQYWSHPDMPWEGAEIALVSVSFPPDNLTVTLRDIKHVRGSHITVSAANPVWADNDTLLFTSDESGYVNPWRYIVSEGTASPLIGEAFPYDCARSAFFLGYAPLAVVGGGTHAVVNAIREGRDMHCVVPLDKSGRYWWTHSPFVSSEPIRALGSGSEFVFLGQKVDEGTTIVRCTLSFVNDNLKEPVFPPVRPLAAASGFPKTLFSHPVPMALKTANGEPLYVIYHPPHNPAYVGTSIDGEKPPCVVQVHGGPTGSVGLGLDVTLQYYTSRGWAVLIVNYSGSAGYGRAYTKRLEGQYGIRDLQDCITAPRTLAFAPHFLIDPKRTVIRGRSSGGYVVLNGISGGPPGALDSNPEAFAFAFAASMSHCGISELGKMEEDTHKFESQYIRKLMGGTNAQIPDVYRERSPLYRADRIATPLLLLQGSEDKVVPKDQSILIYDTIKERRGVVEYKEYEGEGHGGLRRAETRQDAIERERLFYERVLGIGPE